MSKKTQFKSLTTGLLQMGLPQQVFCYSFLILQSHFMCVYESSPIPKSLQRKENKVKVPVCLELEE